MNKTLNILVTLITAVQLLFVGCKNEVKETPKKIELQGHFPRVEGEGQVVILNRIGGMLNSVRNGNSYLKLIEGENSSTTYVYNKHGESIAQASDYNYITVFRNTDTSVRYTNVVDIGPDIDILKVMERSLELVKTNNATLEKPEGSEGEFKVYYVYLEGWNNIRKLYEQLGTEFADTMINSMKQSTQNAANIGIRFRYVLGDHKELSGGCELIKDKIYTLWYFDGYLNLYDWKLTPDWYSFNFKDGKKADEMLDKLLKELDNMFKTYAKDNNITDYKPKESTDK